MERSSCKDPEAEPFLVNEKQAASGIYFHPSSDSNSPSKARSISYWAILIHLAIFCLYTTAYIIAVHGRDRGFALLNNTIQDLDIHIRPTEYVVAGASTYAGGPTAEVDAAWHRLLGNISIRVSDKEIARNGDRTSSVQLPAGGQMVWLGVFHQLHCLVSPRAACLTERKAPANLRTQKKLRQLNYPQSYTAHQTEDERRDQEVHISEVIPSIEIYGY